MRRRARTGILVAGLVSHLVLASTGATVLAADLNQGDTVPATARGGPSTAPSPTVEPPPDACQVVYRERDRWSNGFTADVVLTNNGPGVDGWVLTYTAPPGMRVVHGWNGVWSQQGTQVTVRNANWNATLETGTTVTAGLSAAFDRPVGPPAGFALNDVPCR